MKKFITHTIAVILLPFFIILLAFYFFICWVLGLSIEFVFPKENWKNDFE